MERKSDFMKRQIFQYLWEKQRDGCRYISARDIVHALGNSNLFPYPVSYQPETLVDEIRYEAMIETIDAVVASIEAAPEYVLQGGQLTRETDEEGNARRQKAEEARKEHTCRW